MRRLFLIAPPRFSRRFALSRTRRQPAGRVRHDRGHDQARALSRRSAEDRRELPGIREGGPLQRHAVPSRHQGLHDPGRRLHAGFPAEADASRRSRSSPSSRARPGCRTCPARSRWRARAIRTPQRRSSSSTSVTTSGSISARPIRRATATRCSARSIAGMDVVDKIAKGATGAGGPFPTDVPVEHVIIKSSASSSTQ